MYKDPLNSKKQMKIPIVSILQEDQFSAEQTKFETCMWRTSRQKGWQYSAQWAKAAYNIVWDQETPEEL